MRVIYIFYIKFLLFLYIYIYFIFQNRDFDIYDGSIK